MTPPAALALEDVTRRFGALTALDAAGITVAAGSVHALLGENGAGKTTLMRVAFGMLVPDAGTIRRDGRVVRYASPADAIADGIGMVHQHFSLVPAMTVAENVALGGRGRYDTAHAAARVRRVADATGLALDPAARVGDLPVGAQQRVEIVKALARDARVLILDEPTAVLAPSEARELLTWLRGYAARGGSAVLITHKLADALAYADEVTVLRRGRTVLATAAAATTSDALVAAMIGAGSPADVAAAAALGAGGGRNVEAPTTGATRAPSAAAPSGVARPSTHGAPVLALDGVSVQDARGVARLRDVTCDVHAGEIVGIAAVEGAGQHELLRVLAGRLAPTRGQVRLPEAVGFVPEDRHRDAMLLDASLTENAALREAGRARGLVRWTTVRARTAALIRAHDVRGAAPDTRAGALSGGNQQKFVLGRELDPPPPALVVENPTRGLDIRATAAVLARLREARDAGLAVVVYSSDLDEVLALADRVLAVHNGRVVAVPADREAVGRAMLGAEASDGVPA